MEWTEEMTRTCILGGVRTGRSAKEIIDFFGFSKATVYRVVKKFEEQEEEEVTPKRKKHDQRSDIKRTSEFLEKLEEKIEENPGLNITSLAKEMRVSYRVMWLAVHEDLRYKSYRLKIRQLLTAKMIQKRLERSGKLMNKLKRSPKIKFFSDEKKFIVDQSINRQNDRWLAYEPEDVPIVMKTKNPSSVMVLGVISSKGDVMPPHFFGPKETITKEVYLKVLEEVIVPWMEQVSAGEPYVFQQNGAPAHTSNLVQNWLMAKLVRPAGFWSKELWPPSSPDLNPCDYFLWGVLERRVNITSHPNLTSLKTSIRENLATLDRDMVAGACKRFRGRLESVIAAGGSYFE